jgi:5-formyltetrahydrofolate cyclo-ligase
MDSKALIRKSVRDRLCELPGPDRQQLSAQLCDLLLAQEVWKCATNILLFSSLSDEPDVGKLISEALREGKTVALPRYDSSSASYRAAHITALSDLRPGQFGVMEPAPGCPAMPLNQLDLVLVPGVAFDLAGRRLGRGKGFYDRLLAEVRGHKCGVAFDMQIVAELAEEPHDVRVDSILIPTRWHRCGVAS